VAGTEQPVTFLAEVHFDGNGNVVSQRVGDASPLASFQLTGTYTVNMDCSGTMTLTGSTPSTSTGAGTGTGVGTTMSSTPTPVTLNFVLTPPSQFLSNSAQILSGFATRPAIEFTLSNSSETIFGFGTAQ
jgi:hypothetical protein